MYLTKLLFAKGRMRLQNKGRKRIAGWQENATRKDGVIRAEEDQQNLGR